MQVICSGFDGLDVAYMGHVPDGLLSVLERALERAVEAREPVLVEHGNVRFHVAENGARGGYAFRCDTGDLGATWFFKRPKAKDPWGVRVSVKSLALATYGLAGIRERIEGTLAALDFRLGTQPESIGRVDFAVDVLAPGFALRPDNFVMHARTTRADHEEIEVRQSHGRSGRYTSVTIGKMPGRQVIVYDKRLEATQKPGKAIWFEIWRGAMEQCGLHAPDFRDPFDGAVWRVEIRAGKKCLKDRHKITTWNDLRQKLHAVLHDTMNQIRYAMPCGDSNRSRWANHRLWTLAREAAANADIESVGTLDPETALEITRQGQLQIIDQQLVGLAATRVALATKSTSSVDPYPVATQPIIRAVNSKNGAFHQKIDKARERYGHLQ